MRRYNLVFALLIIVLMSGCSTMNKLNPFPQHVYSSPSTNKATKSTTAYDPKTKPYKVLGVTYYPLKSASGYDEVGYASWYGSDFHGKKTATGEIYNMYGLTAAHKTLPLGTRVKVTNLANGRSAYLVVNDRGPFVRGRTIDLSYGAAKQLGSVNEGVIKVRITAVGTVPATVPAVNKTVVASASKAYHVRVGAYSQRSNAAKVHNQLKQAGYVYSRIRQVESNGRVLHVVQAGSYASRDQADRVLSRLKKAFPSSYITS
ncbi:septal ring lytic transglycosylase RlpA family protein [Salidesulfovibrio onnuriiensis]|uniref:septal ring lytic transglycosylase RlpA family protein n=1 Tax=Salidesulfovibrio onnuriiensis TaxID=2583823 RepID=UPI0011CC4531|nr:septal ring lytic transglycosylase RlpA family protein [Salidesulfovibrio onnuriiensis]